MHLGQRDLISRPEVEPARRKQSEQVCGQRELQILSWPATACFAHPLPHGNHRRNRELCRRADHPNERLNPRDAPFRAGRCRRGDRLVSDNLLSLRVLLADGSVAPATTPRTSFARTRTSSRHASSPSAIPVDAQGTAAQGYGRLTVVRGQEVDPVLERRNIGETSAARRCAEQGLSRCGFSCV